MCYFIQNDALKGGEGNPKPTTLSKTHTKLAPKPLNHVKRGSTTQPFLWLSLPPCPGVRTSEESPNWLQNKPEMIQTANYCTDVKTPQLLGREGSLMLSKGRSTLQLHRHSPPALGTLSGSRKHGFPSGKQFSSALGECFNQ